LKEVGLFCHQYRDTPELAEYLAPVNALLQEWPQLTAAIGGRALADPEEVGAAATDYLMYSGYAVLAYLWARSAQVAQAALSAGSGESAFYEAKLQSARFYFRRILPRTRVHAAVMGSGADDLMAMPEAMFSRD
jgi:hypothetical protein